MGSRISPLIANIFVEEFEVKALSSIPPFPFPLVKVCWWHLCYQQGRTQSGPTASHQQPGSTHTVHIGTNTTRITTIPGHPCHHWTRQHLQHHSLPKTHPHRPISTLGQQPSHHTQTKCLQYPSTQDQSSLFHTGQTGQGTPTHNDSTRTLPVSSIGPQPVATQVHPPQSAQHYHHNQQQQQSNRQQQKEHHHSCSLHAHHRRKVQKKKGIQVHFKGTNTLRTAIRNPKDKDPRNNQTGIIYHYQCPHINCLSAYIGESGRSLGERVEEHFKAPSHIHLHSTTMGHQMDPEQFNIVHKEVNSHSRTIKEAMFIHVQDPTLNRYLRKYQLPHIWDHLQASPTLQCKPSSHPTTPNPT